MMFHVLTLYVHSEYYLYNCLVASMGEVYLITIIERGLMHDHHDHGTYNSITAAVEASGSNNAPNFSVALLLFIFCGFNGSLTLRLG